MSSSKTWRTGIVSFGEKTLQIASHLPARQCYCMLRETLGARSTTGSLKEAMAAQKADTLFWQRGVYERLQKPQDRRPNTQRARAKPSRHGHRHRTNGPRANRPRKVSPGSALQRGKTPIGPRTGPQPPRGGCSAAKTISFVTSALETVADHMDAL